MRPREWPRTRIFSYGRNQPANSCSITLPELVCRCFQTVELGMIQCSVPRHPARRSGKEDLVGIFPTWPREWLAEVGMMHDFWGSPQARNRAFQWNLLSWMQTTSQLLHDSRRALSNPGFLRRLEAHQWKSCDRTSRPLWARGASRAAFTWITPS